MITALEAELREKMEAAILEEERGKKAAEERDAQRLSRLAAWFQSLDADGKALAKEWGAIENDRKLLPSLDIDMRPGRDGAPIYIVKCANGYHESKESFVAALALLVDAHRTRIEDTEEIHKRALPLAGGIKEARRITAALAKSIREANPMASGPELDRLFLEALAEQEAKA